ncbi:MAG: MFS transporter [Fimbriimonadaceae bacterium]|nr:MFS transporter [Fimbriimonadaceae bacterium]
MSAPMTLEQSRTIRRVLLASSAGTLIEWYDFYLFGALATILSRQFFPAGNETAAFLSTLATFGAGFVVRPFGALVFGRMGDLVGRKVTFLLTLVMMGLSTFLIGLLPTFGQIGVAATAILVLLRLVQGLALGGEYGGAATYVAEHAPDHQRGYYTSFIQTTATLGLLLSLVVIVTARLSLGEAAFAAWGWRIPFLLSALLVVVSYFIRRSMEESPAFAALKANKATSANPLKESFLNPENRRWVLLALFGATAGQGVVWYTGQFYAMTFMEKVMNIQPLAVNLIVASALVVATPLFVFVGRLSDRVGRLRIILLGCVLAAVSYVPIYQAMLGTLPPPTDRVAIEAHQRGIPPSQDYARGDYVARIDKSDPKNPRVEFEPGLYPSVRLGLLVFIQVVFVTMVYGPIAAFLVELFPTRIRYTSMSLPYHIGNGVFGGLVPLIATAVVTATGNKLAGLWYPMSVAIVTAIVGALFLREDRNPHD